MKIPKTSIKPLGIILAAFTVFIFIKLFVLDVKVVHGHSMEPTLSNDSIVLINKLAYGLYNPFMKSYFFIWKKPKINDIILFPNPIDGRLVVKRCIAVAGNLLQISDKTIKVGKMIYHLKRELPALSTGDSVVPRDKVFVLGDNKAVSLDSRKYGYISIDTILGKAIILKS